jgi:hypothetical protein
MLTKIQSPGNGIGPMSSLDNSRWIDFPPVVDPRGCLTAIESGRSIPFQINRVYMVHDVVADRGGHAHRDTEQVVLALAGSFHLKLSTPTEHKTFELDRLGRGVHIQPMTYIELSGFSPGAIALVLASTHYRKERSLRSWEEYVACFDRAEVNVP